MKQKLIQKIRNDWFCFEHPNAAFYVFETKLYCDICNGRVIFTIKEYNPYSLWKDSDLQEALK